tara:strand:- start:87 stop:617 length:531 start_codon:yes stop_codon:yes gene_type:complete
VTRLPSEPASRISLAFWLTLVAATGLYGFVSLAPSCLVLGDLAADSADNRDDERALENRIEYLEQVRDTLKADPGYANELAGLDLQESGPGENRLTVDESLRLAPRASLTLTASDKSAGPWAARPIVASLANNDTLRITLLVIAAAMILFAFTALHETHSERLARWGKRLRRRESA